MKNWLIVAAACLVLGITSVLYPWTGSDPTVEIIDPDGQTDTSIVQTPVRVVVKVINTTQGIDYSKFWLVPDINEDGTVDTDEWTAAVQIPAQPIDDINQDTKFLITWLDDTKVDSGKHYFVLGVGKDLSGNTSCDTTLVVGETKEGGGASGIADKAIAWFLVSGRRP